MYHQPKKQKVRPQVPAQYYYVGEDANNYYVMEGFFDGIGNMFKRMVKFTPKSFTPGNIWQGVRNTVLTTATGGIYLALPKNIKKTIEQVSNVALPVAAGVVGASLISPSVMPMLMEKVSSAATMLGKGAGDIAKSLFSSLGKLTSQQQADIISKVTPDDIVSAENTGKIPDNIQQMIDSAAQQGYNAAIQQKQQAQQAQQATQQVPVTPPQVLYPYAYQDMSPKKDDSLSTESIIGITMGGAALMMFLIMGTGNTKRK